MAEFETESGSHNCSGLFAYDISTPEGHDEFIASNVWRRSMRQIEFSVGKLAALSDADEREEEVSSL